MFIRADCIYGKAVHRGGEDLNHRGPLVEFEAGQTFGVHRERDLAERYAGTGPGLAGAGAICTACGFSWYHSASFPSMSCHMECKNCQRPDDEHVEGKCIFAPTRFEAWAYHVIVRTYEKPQ